MLQLLLPHMWWEQVCHRCLVRLLLAWREQWCKTWMNDSFLNSWMLVCLRLLYDFMLTSIYNDYYFADSYREHNSGSQCLTRFSQLIQQSCKMHRGFVKVIIKFLKPFSKVLIQQSLPTPRRLCFLPRPFVGGLFVNRITQKLLDGLPWNSVEECSMSQGRTH